MQVNSIAECSKGSILQYFRPSLSNHLSLRSLFCLFLSGHFTQVLLIVVVDLIIMLQIPVKVLCKVWSLIYYMASSNE